MNVMLVKHGPPLLAASTASAGRPNWFISGPNCPDARALLNMLIACRGTTNTKSQGKLPRAESLTITINLLKAK